MYDNPRGVGATEYKIPVQQAALRFRRQCATFPCKLKVLHLGRSVLKL